MFFSVKNLCNDRLFQNKSISCIPRGCFLPNSMHQVCTDRKNLHTHYPCRNNEMCSDRKFHQLYHGCRIGRVDSMDETKILGDYQLKFSIIMNKQNVCLNLVCIDCMFVQQHFSCSCIDQFPHRTELDDFVLHVENSRNHRIQLLDQNQKLEANICRICRLLLPCQHLFHFSFKFISNL